jgi:hypothetical protein
VNLDALIDEEIGYLDAIDTAETLGDSDERLRDALRKCIEARALIPGEQARLREELEGEEDERKRDLILWQIDFVESHLTRAADAAEMRLAYLNSLNTAEKQAAEVARCGGDILHYFKYWAWSQEPRAITPLKVTPFVPYPFQEDLIRWTDRLVFRKRRAGLVEKAREQGASWVFVLWAVYHWRFKDGFHCLFGSRVENLVDEIKNPDSLLEKARFQIRLLPSWMRPAAFSLDYMKLSNGDNESLISGAAPTPDFGRQGRYTAIVMDEHAAWPHGGFPQWVACSESSESQISLSTPQGLRTKQAELRFDSDIERITLSWQLHPLKDGRWYRSRSIKLTAEAIAQEVDIDYSASQPGRVFPATIYHETHVVITIDELRAFYAAHKKYIPDSGDGLARLPLDFALGRGNDRGATEGHRNAWLWCGVPREGDPLADSVFIFREWLAPLGNSLGDNARTVFEFEKRDKETERANKFSYNSHEAQGERDTYKKEYGLILRKWTTDYQSGIAEITDRFTLRDTNQPHPFRPELMGRPKIYFVVSSGQGELVREESGVYRVRQAQDSSGLLVLRRQTQGYHYPPEEKGKPAGMMRPRKIDDDVIDILRAFAVHKWPARPTKTPEERREDALPGKAKLATIAELPPEDQSQAYASRELWLLKVKAAEAAKTKAATARKPFVNTHRFTSRRRPGG